MEFFNCKKIGKINTKKSLKNTIVSVDFFKYIIKFGEIKTIKLIKTLNEKNIPFAISNFYFYNALTIYKVLNSHPVYIGFNWNKCRNIFFEGCEITKYGHAIIKMFQGFNCMLELSGLGGIYLRELVQTINVKFILDGKVFEIERYTELLKNKNFILFLNLKNNSWLDWVEYYKNTVGCDKICFYSKSKVNINRLYKKLHKANFSFPEISKLLYENANKFFMTTVELSLNQLTYKKG